MNNKSIEKKLTVETEGQLYEEKQIISNKFNLLEYKFCNKLI